MSSLMAWCKTWKRSGVRSDFLINSHTHTNRAHSRVYHSRHLAIPWDVLDVRGGAGVVNCVILEVALRSSAGDFRCSSTLQSMYHPPISRVANSTRGTSIDILNTIHTLPLLFNALLFRPLTWPTINTNVMAAVVSSRTRTRSKPTNSHTTLTVFITSQTNTFTLKTIITI